jgi:hypothetical protein
MTSSNGPINTSLKVRSLSIFSEKPKAIPLKSLLVTTLALGALGLLVVMIMKYRSRTNPVPPVTPKTTSPLTEDKTTPGCHSSSDEPSSMPPEQIKPDKATSSSSSTLSSSSSSSSPTSSSSTSSSVRINESFSEIPQRAEFSETTRTAFRFVLDYFNKNPDSTKRLAIQAALITDEYFEMHPQNLRPYDKNLDETPNFLPVKDTVVSIKHPKTGKTRQMNANWVTLVKGHLFVITQNPFAHNGEFGLRERLFWRCIKFFSIRKVYDLTPKYPKSIAFDITDAESSTKRSASITVGKRHTEKNTKTQVQTSECWLKIGFQTIHDFTYYRNGTWNTYNPRLNGEVFLSTIQHMSKSREEVQRGPILLSCDTKNPLGPMFAVACALKHLAKSGEMTRDNCKILILTLVLSIRIQRNAAAVSDSQIEDLCGYAEWLLQEQAESTV